MAFDFSSVKGLSINGSPVSKIENSLGTVLWEKEEDVKTPKAIMVLNGNEDPITYGTAATLSVYTSISSACQSLGITLGKDYIYSAQSGRTYYAFSSDTISRTYCKSIAADFLGDSLDHLIGTVGSIKVYENHTSGKKYTNMYYVYDSEEYTPGGTFESRTIASVYDIPYGDAIPIEKARTVEYAEIKSNFAGCTDLTDLSYFFRYMENISGITGLQYLKTSNVTDMSWMFNRTGYNSSSLVLDLSTFDTSNVTDMSKMFHIAARNANSVSINLDGWDTSKVTDMSDMFNSVGYASSTVTLDVSGLDTSSVTNMDGMFYYTGRGDTTFSVDVSNFDTSNVTNMRQMFYGTGYSNPNFTLNVSSFDTSNVITMADMFRLAGKANSSFTLNISNFNTASLTNMSGMFMDTNASSIDLSNLNLDNVTTLSNTFAYCSNLTTINFGNNTMPKLTSLNYTFEDCTALLNLDMSKIKFDTANMGTNSMAHAFDGATHLNYIKINAVTLPDADTVMRGMFIDCGTECNGSGKYSAGIPYIYVKDTTSRTRALATSDRPTTWSTSNFIVG